MSLLSFLIALVLGAPSMAQAEARPHFSEMIELTDFLKGNTHTHTSRSDGKLAPSEALGWYRDHGYDFVVLTDHNMIPIASDLRGIETARFTVIRGEEVTYNLRHLDGSSRPVHVNGLCLAKKVPVARKLSPLEALRRAVFDVRKQEHAVAQVNHPNFRYALDFGLIRRAFRGEPLRRRPQLLEIANQHPLVNNAGDARRPSVERLWDRLLSTGHRLYGVASDDMHDYEETPPGQGWVQVASLERDERSICAALEAGHFYSSTGAELNSIRVRESELVIEVAGKEAREALTEFIGSGGRLLATRKGPRASYSLSGGERYVRARVSLPSGKQAWVQPQFVR